MNRIKDREFLRSNIENLISKAQDETFVTSISPDEVIHARRLIETNAFSTLDILVLLTSINLLNAAVKKSRYKNILSYNSIKGNISRLIHHLLNLDYKRYKVEFYVNPVEICAYVEIYNLQFSFHNINLNEKIKLFIESERNIVKPWRGIRLQRIAGELFRLALEFATNSRI